MSALKQWVKQCGGADKAAARLGVTGHAVRFWLRGRNLPRYSTMVKIELASDGRCSIPKIMKHFAEKK